MLHEGISVVFYWNHYAQFWEIGRVNTFHSPSIRSREDEFRNLRPSPKGSGAKWSQ
jgi:hypothetical protein